MRFKIQYKTNVKSKKADVSSDEDILYYMEEACAYLAIVLARITG